MKEKNFYDILIYKIIMGGFLKSSNGEKFLFKREYAFVPKISSGANEEFFLLNFEIKFSGQVFLILFSVSIPILSNPKIFT